MKMLDSLVSKEKRIYKKASKLVEQGREHASHNQSARALENYQKAKQLLDENRKAIQSAQREYSSIYDTLGYSLVEANRVSDGLECILYALRLNPNNISAINHKGAVHLKQNEFSMMQREPQHHSNVPYEMKPVRRIWGR